MSEQDKRQLTAYFPGLVDICEGEEGQLLFLCLQGDQLSAVDDQDGQEPPEREHLPFSVPRLSEVQKWYGREDLSLYADLLSYLKRFSALDEQQWAVVAHYVFLTYLHDHKDVDYCPYILFYAVPERGKSRTGKSVSYVSFRGVHLIELREATIFRYSQNLHGTLFFDLMDVWKKAERSGCEDILLLRYEKGGKCNRVLYPERGPFKDTVYFDVYGPTIIATNEQLHKILETRCLPIVMPNRPGNYENPRLELALELRERLTAWRAKHLNAPLPCLEPPEGISGRLWDISRPLFQVGQLVHPDGEKMLLSAILDIAGERSDSKRETTEGKLVGILRELTGEQGCEELPEWTLKMSDILHKFNEDRPEDKHVSPQWLGRKLKSMSLRHRTVQGRSEICLVASEYLTLLDQYGVFGRELQEDGGNPTETLPKKDMEYPIDTGVVGSSRVSPEPWGEVYETAPGPWEDEDRRDFYEEKAAIFEFEEGLSREEAEQEATLLMWERFCEKDHG